MGTRSRTGTAPFERIKVAGICRLRREPQQTRRGLNVVTRRRVLNPLAILRCGRLSRLVSSQLLDALGGVVEDGDGAGLQPRMVRLQAAEIGLQRREPGLGV